MDMDYFGKAEYETYGHIVAEELAGCVISKRQDMSNLPGGLAYESNRVGLDMWTLLCCLEGMCYNGDAEELDDSTYVIRSHVYEDLSTKDNLAV